MATSSVTPTKDQHNVITNRDYDKVLGFSLCLLTQRLIGRTHLSSRRNFTFKAALVEELDSFQKQLVDKMEAEAMFANLQNNLGYQDNAGFASKTSQVMDCFFYFDAAIRLIINKEKYFSETMDTVQKSSGNFFDTEEDNNAHTFLIREEKLEKLQKDWQRKRARMNREDNVELWQLFFKASKIAWTIFCEVFNEWKTLETLTGVTHEDIMRSDTVFVDLLTAAKILVGCCYFRVFEKKELGIDRKYENDDEVLSKGPEDIVRLLMDSSFIAQARKHLKKSNKGFFGGSMLFKSDTKGKQVKDYQRSVSFILTQSLVLDRLIAKYLHGEKESGKFYAEFQMEKHPSVFQHKIVFEDVVEEEADKDSDKKKKSLENKKERSLENKESENKEPDKKKDDKKNMSKKVLGRVIMEKIGRSKLNKASRIALITEDADTSLLTETDSNIVRLLEAGNERAVAQIKLNSDYGTIQAVTSNRKWLVFGTSNGAVFLYDIAHSSLRKLRVKLGQELPEIAQSVDLQQQKYPITAMILENKEDRLFVGDSMGRILECRLNEEPRKFTLLTKDLKTEIYKVTCLESDERVTLTRRFPSKFLFSGHADGSILVWNILDNVSRLVSWWKAHEGEITALSSRDDVLYSGGIDKKLKMWENFRPQAKKDAEDMVVKTDRESEKETEVDEIMAIAIDYQAVFVASKNSLLIFGKTELNLCETLVLPPQSGSKPSPIRSMAVDRKRNLYTLDESIRMWDIEGILETVDLDRKDFKLRGRRKDDKLSREDSQYVMNSIDKNTSIEEIIESPVLRRRFNEFLVKMYADENLHYVLQVENYEYLAETSVSGAALGKIGKEIIQEHVGESAPHEVNISGPQQTKLLALGDEEFKGQVFEETKREVLKLLNDNFRFNFIQELIKDRASNRGRIGSAVLSQKNISAKFP